VYGSLRMLSLLKSDMFSLPPKFNDEFVDIIATRHGDEVSFLLSNYCDPETGMDYVSRAIGTLSDGECKILLKTIKTGRLQKAIAGDLPVEKIRLTKRLRNMVKKAKELQAQAALFGSSDRAVTVTIKNLKGTYTVQRYTIGAANALAGDVAPVEENMELQDWYHQKFMLKPYSVTLVVLKVKPKEPPPAPPEPAPATEIQAGTLPPPAPADETAGTAPAAAGTGTPGS
jgi:hypothetical protein